FRHRHKRFQLAVVSRFHCLLQTNGSFALCVFIKLGGTPYSARIKRPVLHLKGVTMMKSLQLPGTELTVSQLCLGTNQFGTALDDAAAGAILDAFAEQGGCFLDTARSYGDWIPDAPRGASELALGRLLQQSDRSRWVLATKGCEFDYRA